MSAWVAEGKEVPTHSQVITLGTPSAHLPALPFYLIG